MERLTNTLTEVDERTLLQENFWDRFIITEEKIPEKYRDLQAQILIERGEGRSLSDGKLTPVQKKPLADMVIADQKSSLAQWTKYLSSTDADYSPEMKYWIMRSVTNLQAYNKEQGNFPKRKKDTVAPFPELNQEALALVVNHKMQEIQGLPAQKLTREMTDEEWKLYQQKQSFGDRYAIALKATIKSHGEELSNTKGEWKKYVQGSAPDELVQSLEGKGTGRCTAAYATAQSQLQQGDFYVYYSEELPGAYTKPRVAIRMEGDHIAEVRGIEKGQNIDPYIVPVLEKKLEEFGDKATDYKEKAENMKILTTIIQKIQQQESLSGEELYFLYSRREVYGFGIDTDPRLQEIKSHPEVLSQL